MCTLITVKRMLLILVLAAMSVSLWVTAPTAGNPADSQHSELVCTGGSSNGCGGRPGKLSGRGIVSNTIPRPDFRGE